MCSNPLRTNVKFGLTRSGKAKIEGVREQAAKENNLS